MIIFVRFMAIGVFAYLLSGLFRLPSFDRFYSIHYIFVTVALLSGIGVLSTTLWRSRFAMLPSLLALALAVLIYRVPGFTYAFNGVMNIPLTIFINHPNGEMWHFGFNAIPFLMFVTLIGCFLFQQNEGSRTETDDGLVQ